jgi:uncharacterized coiled-coil protein SlyX
MQKSVKKTSVTSEIVLGQATGNFKKSITELLSVVESIKGLETKVEDLTLQIANKEQTIQELDVKIAEQEIASKLDLDLRMKQNAEAVVLEYLRNSGKAAITNQELSALKTEVETLKKEMSTTIAKEVAIATNSLKSTYESEKKLLIAEHRASEAQNTAQISSLEEKVEFLQEQANMWKEQLVSERQASVDRAKASQINSINVSGPASGR